MTLRTAMRFGDFSKSISKPLDRKAKLFGMSENCLNQRSMRLKFLTLTQVWAYIGELVFNMLVLVGSVKMSDRIIREMMGL